MTAVTNDLFYSRLPVNEISLSELFLEEHLFYQVPGNWQVVITDIKGSTAAIDQGLHETINLLATGSIVAALNIAHRAGISIPFFFGGDGATLIIPPGILDRVLHALLKHQQNAADNFKLNLRVGSIPVSNIIENGQQLTISKLRASKNFFIPVSMGDGLIYAERIIKAEDYQLGSLANLNDELDLSGMQCRWDKIRPPQNLDEVISLLVIATGKESKAKTFKQVIDLLDDIYGPPDRRKPIAANQLKMNGSLRKIGLEMRTRFGKFQPVYLLRAWFSSFLAKLYFKSRKGKKYLSQLIEMSDTLVIDGRINTVISGTPDQRRQLVAELDRLESEGLVMYGLHVSTESVMSCYVRSINEDHIHFVDGADGGYTKAARMIKGKFKQGL